MVDKEVKIVTSKKNRRGNAKYLSIALVHTFLMVAVSKESTI